MILHYGKKHKNKIFASNGAMKNVHVSDDAPWSVREARKRLYEIKSKLSNSGIRTRITQTFWLSVG